VILLDTTVLSYAVGMDHPLREPCRRLLRAHGDGRIEAATTIEVVQEFVHVRARRRSRPDAVALGRRYTTALSLLVARADDLDLGLTLFERHPALGAFDAVLAAVALNQRVEALVSADRAFGEVPNLPWVDPATPNLDHLIGR
jgi:predicted nucleic acid-binding protein